MADEPQDTLAKLRERLARLDQERQRLLIAIQVIGGEGESADGFTIGQGDEQPAAEGIGRLPMPPAPSARTELRPDTFFGLSQHQAARRYLQNVGHADRLENILRDIVAGGVDVGGSSPLATLRATLAQNTSVFVRVSPGTFGLREFYPQLGNKNEARSKPLKGKRKGKEAARKAKKLAAKVKAKSAAKDSAPQEQEA